MSIPKKAYSNVSGPYEYIGTFNCASSDGYGEVPGVLGVERGQADGYYKLTLDRKFPNSSLLYADAKVVSPYIDRGYTAEVCLQTPVDKTVEIATRNEAGTIAPLTDGSTVQFCLKFKRHN